MTTLLQDIEAFLSETGMSETTFCRVVGNGRLFERLRAVGKRGRAGRVWPETEHQVRQYMAAERSKRVAA